MQLAGLSSRHRDSSASFPLAARGSTCPCHNSHSPMPISSNARIAPSRSRSLKLLVCAPICTPAMTEFGGVEASSGTAAAVASLPKSRLEYTGFTSLSLPTYHAAHRCAILTSGTVAGGSATVLTSGFSANRSAATDESQSHGIDRTQDLHRCGFRRTGDHRLERRSEEHTSELQS